MAIGLKRLQGTQPHVERAAQDGQVDVLFAPEIVE